MRKQRELDLLVDIAKLLKKYGPLTFASLAKSITLPEMVQHLSGILTHVAKIGRTVSKTKKYSKTRQDVSIPKALITLKSADPEKYQLLMNLYNALVAKTVLPSLKNIKEFAMDCGLPEVRAKSRQKAISPLIGSLIKSLDELIIAKIQSLKKYDTGDRSLEGWSNIILNRKRKLDENR